MKRIVLSIAVFIVLATTCMFGQEGRPFTIAPQCPFPTTLSIPGGTVAAPVLSEFPATVRPVIAGSVWNQTAINKAFGHTFRFPSMPRECCLMSKGTLTVTVKALQDASPNSSNAGNDSVNVYSGGGARAQQSPWAGTGTIPAGTVKTLTFPLTANDLGTGFLSIYVQDDTAVVKADLVVEGCCLSRQCVDTTTDISTGSNNGTAIAIGATDTHWTVQPPGGSAASAVAIQRGSIAWVQPLAGTQWINSAANPAATGLYVYKFNFDLGKEWPDRTCRLSLQYAVDNDLTMQLDGGPAFASTAALTVASSHFTALHAAATPVPATGPHVLTVNVTNASGPTGLLISGKVVCSCKGAPPPTVLPDAN
jgi:hypothetical protein